MRYTCLLLMVSLAAVFGQEKPAQDKTAPGKPAAERSSRESPRPEKAPEEQATRSEKARELLESASKLVPSVQPQVQVAALLHLGDNFNLVDRKKAIECLERAFASASELPSGPEDPRGDMQARVVESMADVDLAKALEMLPQLAAPTGGDPRLMAIQKVVRLLLDKKDLDRAIEVVESVGSTGEYPFHAARLIFEKLPEDDGRRAQVFSAASAAFAVRPRGPFAEFLSKHWQAVSRPVAEAALQAVLNSILDKKEEGSNTTNLSTAKGMVSFRTQQDRQLFDLIHVMRELDSKRAASLLEARPELRAAVDRFPTGMASMGGDNISMSVMQGDKPDQQAQGREQLQALARSRAAEALSVMKEDPQKALSLVRGIPVPALQAQVLGSVARTVSDKDPSTAKSVLDQSLKILDEIKEPRERLRVWSIVAEAAHRAKENLRAWEAIDRGLSDAAALYKRDADVESPNQALREFWPSTQSYRAMMHRAASLFGAEAEPLLAKITDPELALLARIEIAQALLDRPLSVRESRFSSGGRGEVNRFR